MPSTEDVVRTARDAFESGRTKSLAFREKQLKALMRLYEEHSSDMVDALRDDLKKSKQESMVSEIIYMQNELRGLLYNFRNWSKPETIYEKGLANVMDGAKIYKDPYGVVLVIGAWNYPLQLSLVPAAAAIAAGNCVIIKPSEVAPASAKLMAELIPKYLDKECYQVYLGGVPETSELLKQRFDYIFFTGSTAVGKIVHQAAAKHLTPTTLELGGKSPVFIHNSADVEIAARRVMWGKCFNAGQSCISPDYVICSKEVQDKFVEATKTALKEWYGEKIKQSPDFGRIINDHHFKRIIGLIGDSKIALGGDFDASQRYISPTIVVDVKESDPIMQEEIFGPVLPIINIDSLHKAMAFINKREKPLALYVFSNDNDVSELFMQSTTSGGALINDTMMHFATDGLPFGGVGCSGMGRYHGKDSFDTFVHKKPTLVKKLSKFGEMLMSCRYPPFNDSKIQFISIMTRKYPLSFKYLPLIIAFSAGAGFTLIANWMTKKYEE